MLPGGYTNCCVPQFDHSDFSYSSVFLVLRISPKSILLKTVNHRSQLKVLCFNTATCWLHTKLTASPRTSVKQHCNGLVHVSSGCLVLMSSLLYFGKVLVTLMLVVTEHVLGLVAKVMGEQKFDLRDFNHHSHQSTVTINYFKIKDNLAS